ncbi:MAG: VanZ family protein [Xanthomonadaceae bacterium]|nr:VanZ family protein [Xanthomonadaceae bacterium]
MAGSARQALRSVLLLVITVQVLVALLLPNTTIAWMREHWHWFNLPMSWVERIGGPLNLIHVALFLLLGAALALRFPHWPARRAGIALLAFGTLTELAQLFVPGRHARLSDVGVDLLAGLLGWLCIRKTRKKGTEGIKVR